MASLIAHLGGQRQARRILRDWVCISPQLILFFTLTILPFIVGLPTVPDSAEATRSLLDRAERPTVIMSVNDYLALGILRGIAQVGLRVPDDISVAGFDNTALASQLTPALTSIDVGGADIGRSAVRLLFERINRPTMPTKTVELSPRLVIRDSTEAPRR